MGRCERTGKGAGRQEEEIEEEEAVTREHRVEMTLRALFPARLR